MPLSAVSPLISARFHEVDVYLAQITGEESANPHVPDTLEVRIKRGLFFVHLYGAFEYSHSQAFSRLAQYISSRSVACAHLTTSMYSIACDDQFRSLGQLGHSKGMRKRVEITRRMDSDEVAVIPDSVLAENLQSTRAATVRLAFDTFGIVKPALISQAAGGYIDEVADKRNAVAHGRESAADIGVMRANELRVRYDALYRQCIYTVNTLSAFIRDKNFVNRWHRKKY